MPIVLDGTNGITQADQFNSDSTFGFKNRIINGAMVIDQRNAGASVTNTALDVFPVDRWDISGSVASKFTAQQNAGSVTPPTGFSNYLGVTSLSAYSVSSSDQFIIAQAIEGFNTADLNWGTANAKTVTLSFQVYSSLTGTFGGSLKNSAGSRSYPFTFTVSSANTWTTISVIIAGDTSGTWIGATNGVGLYVNFGLGCGSTASGTAGAWASANYQTATGATSVVGTNGATFYITGVQLEVGSTATSFDYRPYGTELALCQRYYYLAASAPSYIATGGYYNSTLAIGILGFPTTMRATPTLSATSGTNYYTIYRNGAGDSFDSLNINAPGVNYSGIENSTNVSGTGGDVGFIEVANAAVKVAFQAEL